MFHVPAERSKLLGFPINCKMLTVLRLWVGGARGCEISGVGFVCGRDILICDGNRKSSAHQQLLPLPFGATKVRKGKIIVVRKPDRAFHWHTLKNEDQQRASENNGSRLARPTIKYRFMAVFFVRVDSIWGILSFGGAGHSFVCKMIPGCTATDGKLGPTREENRWELASGDLLGDLQKVVGGWSRLEGLGAGLLLVPRKLEGSRSPVGGCGQLRVARAGMAGVVVLWGCGANPLHLYVPLIRWPLGLLARCSPGAFVS